MNDKGHAVLQILRKLNETAEPSVLSPHHKTYNFYPHWIEKKDTHKMSLIIRLTLLIGLAAGTIFTIVRIANADCTGQNCNAIEVGQFFTNENFILPPLPRPDVIGTLELRVLR